MRVTNRVAQLRFDAPVLPRPCPVAHGTESTPAPRGRVEQVYTCAVVHTRQHVVWPWDGGVLPLGCR